MPRYKSIAHIVKVFVAKGMLNRAGILTQQNAMAVTTHINPLTIARGMRKLNQAGILTQSNTAAMTTHPYSKSVVKMIRNLSRANILTQANFNTITEHAKPPVIANAIRDLSDACILSEESFNVVTTHAHPSVIAKATLYLNWADILTQENFNVVTTHTNPSAIADVISSLENVGILTQSNFDIVTTHTNSSDIANVICSLENVGILTQSNFNRITTPYRDPLVVMFDLYAKQVRHFLPENLLTYTQTIERQKESFPETFDKLGIEPNGSIQCTIMQCVPRIPVLLNCGHVSHVYDLDALKRLINLSNFTGKNPMDRSRFTLDDVQPAQEVVNQIRAVIQLQQAKANTTTDIAILTTKVGVFAQSKNIASMRERENQENVYRTTSTP